MALEIPKNKKKYTWDSKKNRHVREILGHYPGDEGLEMNGRFHTYHPTKGWRTRSIKEQKKENTEAPILLRWFRNLCRAKGLTA